MTIKRDSAAPAGTGASLRERILAAKDIRTEEVEVPEWGLTVTVRGLTGEGRDALEGRITDSRGRLSADTNYRAAFAALCIVDEDGERVFTDADIKALGEKSSIALQRVYEAAVSLSATRPEDVDGITSDLKDAPSDATGSD